MLKEQQKHLELIQVVISRMAQNSFKMKGWSVTLVSGILIVAHEIAGWPYLLIALLPDFVFWGFDAYYLRQEKLYRELFNFVRLQDESDWKTDPFTMNTASYSKKVSGWLKVCCSHTIVWLYLPMLLLITGISIWTAICR